MIDVIMIDVVMIDVIMIDVIMIGVIMIDVITSTCFKTKLNARNTIRQTTLIDE